MLERIDFGPAEMQAEGVAAARSFIQPVGELRQAVLEVLVARLRAVFGGLWEGEQVNMMQFTQIGPGRCLGNHFDRRDKWREGIASVAWGEAESPTDARGDSWTLCMQQSAEQLGKVAKEVELQLPPGSAYILTCQAQGRTAWCEKQSVAHQARALLPPPPPPPRRSHPSSSVASFSLNPSPKLHPNPEQACTCCWTHGIWNRDSTRKRHSITLRAYDVDWGRHDDEARRGGDQGDEAGGG